MAWRISCSTKDAVRTANSDYDAWLMMQSAEAERLSVILLQPVQEPMYLQRAGSGDAVAVAAGPARPSWLSQ